MNQKEMKKKIINILFVFLLFNFCSPKYYKKKEDASFEEVTYCPSYMTPYGTNDFECISWDDCQKLHYYNKDDLMCYSSLPDTYYENEIDINSGFPKEDEGKNTITLKSKGCKSSFFPKLTAQQPQRCQMECNSNEYYKSNEPNKCLSSCFETEADYNKFYIGSNKECLTECPYFYIEEIEGEHTIKKCLVNCEEYNKFFFENEKKCYGNCLDGGHQFYFSDNYEKECLNTCKNNTIKKYVKINDNSPSKCLEKSESDYFDEDYNILGNSCGSLYKSFTDPHMCVSFCIKYNYTSNNVKECISCENNYEYSSTLDEVRCVDSCNYILDFRTTYEKECLTGCPKNYIEETIDGKKHCNTIQCPDGKLRKVNNCDECSDFYIIDQGINICQDKCESPNFIKDSEDKECVSYCPEYNNVIVSSNNCGKFCDTNKKLNIVSTQTVNGKSYTIYECIDDCPFLVKEIDEGTKEYCFDECPDRFQFKLNDANNKECIQECPSDKSFYNINDKNIKNYYTCTNQNPCTGDDNIYCEGKCINKNSCLNEKIYFINNQICADKCSDKYRKKTVTGGYITECDNDCTSEEYIVGSECLEKCPKELNYIGNGNKCKNGCKSEDGDLTYYKFEEDYSDYKIYKCVAVSGCSIIRYHDNFCYDSCPKETYQLDNVCYENCFLSSKKFSLKIDENQPGECLDSSCKNGYKYYYKTDQVCLDKCKNDDYLDEETNICVSDCRSLGDDYYYYENTNAADGVQKKFCVKACRDPQPYLYGNTCVESCGFPESEKRYIVIGGSNTYKCLTDCISPYIYYKEKGDKNNQKHYYECSQDYKDDEYNYYAPNSIRVGQESLKTCNYNDQKYKYNIDDKCYEQCPEEKPYYILNNGKFLCKENCPEEAPFHEIDQSDSNSFFCKTLDQCNNEYADIEVVGLSVVKKCLRKEEKCEDSKKVGISDGKFVCISQCDSTTYGQFLTEYNTCTNICQDYALDGTIMNYKGEGQNCTCENLFYKAENEKTCFPDSINICSESGTIYAISYGQDECISVCDQNRILSLDEKVCYDYSNSFLCSSHDDYTHEIVRTDGIKKCDCENKFYLDPSTNLKTCFNEECGDDYNKKYVPEIQRCMKNDENCPEDFNHVFLDKLCLRQCPSGSTEQNIGNEVKCECNGEKPFWRNITHNNYECLVRCPLVYIATTSECVNSCPTDFPVFYNFKCFASCENSDALEIKNGEQVQLQNNVFSEQTCACAPESKWYMDGNTKHCVNSCFDGDKTFKYEIVATRECVDECPIDNYYTFNEYCYNRCEDNDKLKANEPYRECLCKNGWYYTNDDKTRRQCLESDQTCISINVDKNYLIESTKECVNKCPEYLFEFNHVCYDVCPENTIDHINENGNYCTCNLNDGYWYEYLEYGFTFKSCGWKECPEYEKEDGTKALMNLIENEKQCVKSCKTDGSEDYQNYYAFKNICIKDCPILTKTNDADDECYFYDLTLEANIINNKDKFKDAANIQTNELYAKDDTSYNKFGFAFDIYPIDDTSKKTEAINSKKAYIDFSSCLERIYLDKNITDPEQILIAKYDVFPEANSNIDKNNDKYLINPVEYELFSSSDTNERMDALVCEPNEIVVSYPLCLDKFDRKEGDVDQNEFRDKFDIGKKLYEDDNSIDTFNFNNTIYKDFCRGLEIDGKDLVFEDRYKYLYPYNKILCESNCTLNNTDFKLERVNCLCAYKGDFDFYRKEYETNDIFNDEKYFIPSQSGANAEAIKCLFNFTFSQATVKNEAFYCCFLITAVEVALLFVNIVYGIKGVSDNIKKSLNKLNDIFRKSKNNQNKNGNVITTTSRPLNNPPRKNIQEEEKDDDNMTSESYDKKSGKSDLGEYKLEYIPFEYISKFFKQNDYGVLKKIERSEIPFKISPDTKYLVDKRNGGNSDNNYLILTDSKTNKNDINKMIKYIKDEKINKNKFEPKTKRRVNLIEEAKYNENLKKINDKNLIKVKKLNPINNEEYTEDFAIDDFEKENGVDIDSGNASCITLIRREQLFLRIGYEKYIAKKHPSNAYIFFAEVLDKIYLVKIILFLGKYDIFCIQLSLYVFCYLLLLSLICGFFTIKVIKKIWEQDNYPNVSFYLLYGLISHIILWIIYKIFLYLLDCSDKIKELLLIKKTLKEEDFIEEFIDNSDEKNQNIINKKYKEQASQMRFRIFVFYVLMFAIIIFCTIYLISFFSIYTGTKKKVFIAYFISLFEILLIKVVYGLCLAALRLASKVNKMKYLYDLVYIFDKFIS